MIREEPKREGQGANKRKLPVAIVSVLVVVGMAALLGVATQGVLAQEQPDQADGSSVQLDGEFGHVSGASNSLGLSGKSMTIQAWVKHDGDSQENAVIVRKGNGYRLELSGSGEERPVKFQISGSGFDSMTSNRGIPANRWTHVSATYDGNQMQIYIDGELDASKGEDSDIDSDQSLPLVIGSGPSASEKFFSGGIDDVRIWDKSLSKFELQTNPYEELDGTESDLVSYYTFDGDSTEKATDQSGQNDLDMQATSEKVSPDAFPVAPDTYAFPRSSAVTVDWDERLGVQDENKADSFRLYRSTNPDGSDRTLVTDSGSGSSSYTDTPLTNGETYYYEVTTVVGGLESDYSKAAVVRPYNESGGSSLALDGEDEYATLSDRPSKDLNLDTNEMTVEAWVKHDGESDEGATIVRNGNGWRLEIDGSGEERPVFFQISGSGFDSMRSNGGIHANEWTHVAATYDGNEMKIFLNGELDATKSEDADISAPNRPVRLGTADGADSAFFSGRIDDVRIWSTAREETQIRENYTQELTGNEAGLNGYWRFDNPGASVARGSGRLKGTFELKDGATVEEDGTFPVPARVYARGDDGSARVTWSERVSGDKLSLYRSTDEAGSDRQKVTELSPGGNGYTDSGVSNGDTYYYEITTEDAGRESDFSVPATAVASSNTPGKAFDFDTDQDSFGTLTPRPSLVLQDRTMAIEAWIRFNESSDDNPTIIRRDGGWRMVLTGTGANRPVKFQVSGSGFDSITSNQGITAGEWTHVAGTYDGSELALYINGELDSTKGEDASVSNPGQDITIGTINSKNSNFYAGQIDELRVWDTWRSPEQVNSSYDNELVGDEDGLVGYWRGCNVAGNEEARGSAVRPMTVNMTNMGCQTSGAPMEDGGSTGGTLDFGIELPTQSANVSQGGTVDITSSPRNNADQPVSGAVLELVVDQNQDGQFGSGEAVASKTVSFNAGEKRQEVLTYTDVQLSAGTYSYQARIRKNGEESTSFTNGTLNVTASGDGDNNLSEGDSAEIQIDPSRTYLHVSNDNVGPSMPIDLSEYGIEPGDQIELTRLGDFDNGGSGSAGLGMIGVFSENDTILSGDQSQRVPGALGAGGDHTTPSTYYGDETTDIPEDFLVANNTGEKVNVTVTVPEGAEYVTVAARDSLYEDNSDPDGDFAVRITVVSEGGGDGSTDRVGISAPSDISPGSSFTVDVSVEDDGGATVVEFNAPFSLNLSETDESQATVVSINDDQNLENVSFGSTSSQTRTYTVGARTNGAQSGDTFGVTSWIGSTDRSSAEASETSTIGVSESGSFDCPDGVAQPACDAFVSGGEPKGELDIIDILVDWNNTGTINGENVNELDLIDLLVAWNSARS